MNKSTAEYILGIFLLIICAIVLNEWCGCIRIIISDLNMDVTEIHNNIGRQVYSKQNHGIGGDQFDAHIADLQLRKKVIIDKIDGYRNIDAAIRKYADSAVYVLLPYLIFTIMFFYAASHDPKGETRPITHGYLASSALCIIVFLYLSLVSPVKCNDLACLVTLVGIPSTLLIAGIAVALAIKFLRTR